MHQVALRAEYQLSVDGAQNRILYENFLAMRGAVALPGYVSDWQMVLQQVRPGFSVLCDMRIVNQANPGLLPTFQAVEQLIVAAGVGLVAEVHVPGLPTRRYSDDVTTEQAMAVSQFMSVWEALQFLDEPA